ncbi:MAG: hypothetical protein M3470_09705 [Chloroflexota bacterium]|nr:hypothetical protein [Chloroflexota bacterium]
MEREQIRVWLDTTDQVRSACDLDLLLFFTRHSHVLLTTEQIVNFVGYSQSEVAEALEHLLEAGLVTRLKGRAADADLYIFNGSGRGAPLSSLLDLASTRDGRLAVIDVLPKPTRTPRGALVALRAGERLRWAG